MSSYLELCQKVARDSGTISGTLPASVNGQSGRLFTIVEQVKESWRQIQTARNAWLFHFKTFTGSLTAGTQCYTPASFNITDLARWITDVQEEDALSLYLDSVGVEDEAALRQIDYWQWRKTYDRGAQVQNRPIVYAISPSNELCFGPNPDAACTVKGAYYRTPQVLADDDDEPICPARFHDVIAWHALWKLGWFDEGEAPIKWAQQEYRALMQDLEREQLPRIEDASGPLA